MPNKNTYTNLYAVIAREVTTDAADGMTSIIKLIEKFNFTYNPQELTEKGATIGKDPILFNAKYAVATSWSFGKALTKDTGLTFRIGIVDPSGVNRGGPSSDLTVPSGMDRANFNLTVEGMPILTAGSYSLLAELVSSDSEVLATGSYPFTVELSEESKPN